MPALSAALSCGPRRGKDVTCSLSDRVEATREQKGDPRFRPSLRTKLTNQRADPCTLREADVNWSAGSPFSLE